MHFYENFSPSHDSPFTFFSFYLMSITKYFTQRNTKVIDNDPTPACSPLFLASRHQQQSPPCKQPPSKTRTTTRTTRAYLVTNHTKGLTDVEDREEMENKEKENRALEAPRKQEQPSQEMELTLLIMLMRLFCPEPQLTLQMMTLMQITHKLCVMKAKVRERNGCGSSCHKEAACQQHLPSWLLRHPSFQFPLSPVTTGYHPSHQGVVTAHRQEKGDR